MIRAKMNEAVVTEGPGRSPTIRCIGHGHMTAEVHFQYIIHAEPDTPLAPAASRNDDLYYNEHHKQTLQHGE
jgi:hypothetical protein